MQSTLVQFAALPNGIYMIGGAILALLALIFAIVILNFGMIWIRAFTSGAPVKFSELIALRLRRIPVGMIVDARITAVKSGIEVKETGHSRPVSIDDLSTHYLAGGNVEMVVQALINARKAGIHLDFDRACAIDLATKGTGKTVIEAVRTSVNPKVIDCPAPSTGKTTIDAVAKDGIVIRAKARVTVRTNLDRFVGGATEETIIARVGEGIVSTIGSSASYKDVLENPDRISKTVLNREASRKQIPISSTTARSRSAPANGSAASFPTRESFPTAAWVPIAIRITCRASTIHASLRSAASPAPFRKARLSRRSTSISPAT